MNNGNTPLKFPVACSVANAAAACRKGRRLLYGMDMTMIKVKNILLPVSDDDGFRVFADPVWPRKVSREKTVIDVWFRDLSPSPDLYAQYMNNQLAWEEFLSRYHGELAWHRDYFRDLQAHNHNGGLTILHGSKNEDRNIAVALKMFLEQDDTAPRGAAGAA